MKKITLTLIALLGICAGVTAQETETPADPPAETSKRVKPYNFYVGFGVNVLGDYKLNDKLQAAALPKIASAAPEVTFGFNYDEGERYYQDIEVGISYMDDRNAEDRMKTTVTSLKIRPQYKFVDKKDFFFSAGIDLAFSQTYVNLYARNNVIDLNDLDPSAYTGNMSFHSSQFAVGPAVALQLFKKSFPLRINAGYNVGLTNGKWKSDYANVTNTVKESGHGNFYAKLSIGF